MPIHPSRLVLAGETGDHPGVGGARDRADDDGVEEDAQFPFLLLHLVGPVGEAQPAQPVVGPAGRDRVGVCRPRP